MPTEERTPSTTTKETKEGNPRPYPTTPRNKDGAKPRIFALLIGINDYQGTVSKLGGCVSDVNLTANYLREQFGDGKPGKSIGAKDAVDTTEEHGRLHLRILTNKKATYAAIIKAFDEHLVKGGGTASDTFWFHFSGHGTEQFTAEEFSKPTDAAGNALPSLEPNGKDQSLVCYNPGGTQAGIFLADKEIAAMIDTLNKALPAKDGLPPHIVVSLDCCHSGSGTRDFMEPPGFKSRNHDFLRGDGLNAPTIRPLDSYYNGYYSKQKSKKGSLSIPHAKHVLLSACTNVEKAGDLPVGGVFSSSLISVLKDAAANEEEGTLNYADLFVQTRSVARSKRNAQNPQFEPIAGFNPHTAFLEGWSLGDSEEYELIPRGDDWYLGCGAVHGLPTTINTAALPEGSPDEIIVKVYKKKGKEFLGHALVTDVGVQESNLELLKDLQGKLKMIKASGSKKNDRAAEPYVAEIFQMPQAPFYVHLDGTPKATAALREHWTKLLNEKDKDLSKLNILIARNAAEQQEAKARVEINESGYQIWEVEHDRPWNEEPLVVGGDMTAIRVLNFMKIYLRRIARWTRLLALKNEEPTIDNDFQLELLTLDYGQWVESNKFNLIKDDAAFLKNAQVHTDPAVRLLVPQTSFVTQNNIKEIAGKRVPWKGDAIFFSLRLKTTTDNLFFYLYDFRNDAAIAMVHEVSLEKQTSEEGVLLLKKIPFHLEDNETEGTLRLKLLVTQERLENSTLLVQEGVNGTRAGMGDMAWAVTTDGWQAYNLTMTVVRQQDSIKPAENATLMGGDITILPHAGVKANLSVTATGAQESNRSLNANPLRQLENLGIELVNFRKERSLSTKNVLELNNLEVKTPAELAKNPLQIQLNDSLAADEVMVPLTFDGEFLRVIGDAETVGDRVQVNIRELPNVEKTFDENGGFVPNPLGAEEDERSLIKGLKMVFLKWSAKREEDEEEQADKLAAINKLCWVKYLEEGTIDRRVENVAAQVKLAKNILLTVHGIIGDTESIAANVPHMINAKGGSLGDKYDLVLTYDYENLNTPIQETAEDLQKKLAAVGITAEGGKKITILAHSMGGLVTRHLIEKLGGSAYVKHLVMAGTPNAGSPFGNVPDYFGFTTNILDMAINFLPTMLPVAGKLRKGLKFLSDAELFETLAQMQGGSKFLEALNDPNQQPDGVKYSILAGDVSKYVVEGSGFSRFMERSTIAIGNLANKPKEHDIAVSVEGILNDIVWKARQQQVETTTVGCHHLNYFITDVGRAALAEILS